MYKEMLKVDQKEIIFENHDMMVLPYFRSRSMRLFIASESRGLPW